MKLGSFRKDLMGWTDKRVGLMSEIINGIQMIKFYAWEGMLAHYGPTTYTNFLHHAHKHPSNQFHAIRILRVSISAQVHSRMRS